MGAAFRQFHHGPVSDGDIEGLWSGIADEDDWSGFERRLAEIEVARLALLS